VRTPLQGWYVLTAVAVASLAATVLLVLLPSNGDVGDGPVYAAMAHHPFDTAHQPGPYAFRILVPLLVWLLPLSTELSFHVLVFVGLVAGATITAVLARDLGIEPRRALLAAPLYVLPFAGVFGVYQYRMLEPETAALTSAAFLLAWRGRARVFTGVGMLAAAARDLGVTVPVAWWAAQRGPGRELRAIAQAVLLGLPIVATYLLIQILVPHPPGTAFFHSANRAFNLEEIGIAKFLVRSLVQGYGILFLLWPIGIALGTRRWRSFHLYVLFMIPVLYEADWNRMTIYLLPFVLPSALLALERCSYALCAVVAAASAYVAFVLSLHNIPDSAGYPSGAAMLVPGALIGIVAALPAVGASVLEIGRRFSARSSPAT
jgi:hypothetical protein